MFKIEDVMITELIDIKYNDVVKKEKITNFNFCNETIKLEKNIEIKECEFSGIIFDKEEIKFSNIEDVKFINCDLSNISFIDTSFYRVRFENCKLFGINFIDCNLDNAVIKDSLCNMSNIAGAKIINSKICNSNFKDSRIMSCNFKKVIFDDINFINSEFINTSLKNIDLSSCNIEKIKIDLDSIKGAVVSFEQSLDLIGLLGIKIKE